MLYHNSTLKFKLYLEIFLYHKNNQMSLTIALSWALTRSLTMAILSSVDTQWLFSFEVFAKVFLQKCFIFKKIHRERVFNEKLIHKATNSGSRKIRINYIRLSEQIKMIIIFVTSFKTLLANLMFYFPVLNNLFFSGLLSFLWLTTIW